MGNFLDLKGSKLRSQWSNLAEIRTCQRFYACPRYLQVLKGSNKKQPRKGGDIIFPIISQWGFLLPWKLGFWSNLPQNLMQPFTHPSDATHKIWSRLANWLQSYSSSEGWNFRHSRASNSKVSGLIQPKIEFDRAFMPVLVTSNFDDDSIKNEQASMETPFSHYKSMGNFLDAQGQLTP